MEINKKIWSITAVIFSIMTLLLIGMYFGGYIKFDFVMIALGLSELFSGISQMELSNRTNSNAVRRRNKSVGIFSIIIGIVIFSMAIFQIFFRQVK
ncbi:MULTISPECIES: hypothetical protein [Clostridium]|jgi:uncharacterized membrane protein YedE/YeeE|nr:MULTISPECIES: hypothetical protein [Clostridium]MDB1932572.1 hypothetical protein [Clostridium tertium]MDB1938768.1 hypothetical protein [Clostridium tertium]MDU2158642.1 hypothetical protein [Clostridium sp.]MDU7147158.1 hypothetical protein [Clostridium sp.]